MSGYFSDAQMAQLLTGINPARVSKDGKGFSHVEAYEIRAHLNRVLGFARWSQRVVSQELVFESSTGTEKPKWTVCYRSIVELVVCSETGDPLATYTEGATGDATNLPSRADAHDMALKTSQSQAFKRCAMNLGDQFGLSLYNKGSHRALVMRTLIWAAPGNATATTELTEHITTPLAAENGEPENPQRETSSPPANGLAARASSAVAVAEPVSSPAAELSPEATAGARLLNGEAVADGEYPIDAEGAQELAAAQATVAEVFGPTEPPAQEPWDWCLAEVAVARTLPPAEAMVRLNKCLEVAVRHQLRARRIPGQEETLGAALVRLTGLAATAAQRKEAS